MSVPRHTLYAEIKPQASMDTKEIRKEQEMTEAKVLTNSKSLDEVIQPIMKQLKTDQKFAATHIFKSTLHSVARFARQEAECGRQKADAAFPETLFQTGTLKAYEEWLRSNQASWNTVSTYMRTLRAVYNRIVPPGTVGHNPKLFDDVHTKINSYAKRALTDEQMQTLMETDITTLPKGVQCALAYCLLMFLFRGMAFIDLAHLQKRDIRGNSITYCHRRTQLYRAGQEHQSGRRRPFDGHHTDCCRRGHRHPARCQYAGGERSVTPHHPVTFGVERRGIYADGNYAVCQQQVSAENSASGFADYLYRRCFDRW